MGLLEDIRKKASGIIAGGTKSLYTSNPLLLQNPIKPQATPQPVFGVTSKPTTPISIPKTAVTTPEQTTQTATDTVKGIVKGGGMIANFGKEIIQGTARSAAATGTYGAGRIAGLSDEEARKQQFQTDTKFKKALFGDKGVSVDTEGTDVLKSFGVSEKNAGKFAAPAVIGMTALDLFTGGSGSKVVKSLAKATDRKVVEGLLNEVIPHFNTLDIEVRDFLITKATQSKNTDEIKNILNTAANESKKTAPRIYSDTNLPTPKEDEQVVRFVHTGGPDGKQFVDTNLSRPHQYEGTVEYGVVKKNDIKTTGNEIKDADGYRLIDSATADDVINKNISKSKVDVDTYIKDQTKARESARGSKSLGTRTSEFIQNIENKMVDFTAPIQRRYDKAAKNDPLMLGKDSVKDDIDRVFNAPAITSAFVKEKGFSKVVQEVGEKNLDAFDQYLTAKHAMDLEAKGIKTGRNMDADSELVRQLEPQFEKAAQEIQKYNEARLDYMVDSGLISKELKDELLTKHPNYVPFQRVFSEDELANMGGFGSSGVASLGKQTVVQKIVGSNRQIESPLESMLELTHKAVQQGEKNKAALTLTSYADIKGNPFGLKKIAKTTDAAPDKGTISVLRNGKKEIWEVDADVAKAAKALDVERMNILGKILAFPLRVARLGITGVNIPFVAANVARDQISAFIMSDKGLRSSIANPRIFLAGLGNAIGHGKLYDEMLSEGALMTSFDIARDKVKPTLKSIVADKSKLSKAGYIVRNPKQWFRAVEDLIGRSEEVTRMQQYAGNKQAVLAEGMTEAQARRVATRAARENSTNFARRGEWGTVMNNTILYLNAGIQGSRLLVRNLKNKPLKTSAKIATTLLLPAATITYWNLSDPTRKQAYEDIQEYEKENNFIIVPPNPVKDENGRWEVIKIPLPPGVGQFTNFVRRPIEASQGLDEVSFAEAAANMLRVVSPTDLSNPASSLTPQAIKPSIQAATNKNLFTGYDIVPKSMQDLPAEQQVKETTSGTAEDIGNALGVSPIKTEQFINDTFGGLGPQALNAIDRIRGERAGGRSIAEGVERRFTSAAGNKLESEQLDEIYSLKTEARGESAALKNEAQAKLSELSQMSGTDAKNALKAIAAENPELAKEIIEAKKDEMAGLTKVDSAIKQLPVKDGTRAAYIYNEFKEIGANNKDDAKAYLIDLRKKKVISDEVWEQLTVLIKQDAASQ